MNGGWIIWWGGRIDRRKKRGTTTACSHTQTLLLISEDVRGRRNGDL